jgi:hypothetical protein
LSYLDKIDAKVVILRNDASWHPGWTGNAEIKSKTFTIKVDLSRTYPTLDEVLGELEAQLRHAFAYGSNKGD